MVNAADRNDSGGAERGEADAARFDAEGTPEETPARLLQVIRELVEAANRRPD